MFSANHGFKPPQCVRYAGSGHQTAFKFIAHLIEHHPKILVLFSPLEVIKNNPLHIFPIHMQANATKFTPKLFQVTKPMLPTPYSNNI